MCTRVFCFCCIIMYAVISFLWLHFLSCLCSCFIPKYNYDEFISTACVWLFCRFVRVHEEKPALLQNLQCLKSQILSLFAKFQSNPYKQSCRNVQPVRWFSPNWMNAVTVSTKIQISFSFANVSANACSAGWRQKDIVITITDDDCHSWNRNACVKIGSTSRKTNFNFKRYERYWFKIVLP